jgi:hypothetical protein
MKNFKISLFVVFLSINIYQSASLPDQKFRDSLRRGYDRAKDVGADSYAFGSRIPTKPSIPKKWEPYQLPFVREQSLGFKKKKPYIPTLRLKWSEIIASSKK